MDICKNCTQFVDEGHFSFWTQAPAFLNHTTYCGACFDSQVQPEMANYDQMMEKAKNIHVFEKNQSKETRLIKRLEEPVQILVCDDEKETVLRLAFLAAEKNYNSIIDVETSYKKIKNGSYTNLTWSGSGIPAHVDDKKLLKDRSTWNQPN